MEEEDTPAEPREPTRTKLEAPQCSQSNHENNRLEIFASLLGEASKQTRNTLFLLIVLSAGILGALFLSRDLQNIEKRLEATDELLDFLTRQNPRIESPEAEWLLEQDRLFETEQDVRALKEELKKSGRAFVSSRQETTGILPSSIDVFDSILFACWASVALLFFLHLQLQRELTIVKAARLSLTPAWSQLESYQLCLNHVLILIPLPGSPTKKIVRYAPQAALFLPALTLLVCTFIAINDSRTSNFGGIALSWACSLVASAANHLAFKRIAHELQEICRADH